MANKKLKGTWMHRCAIWFFTIVLAVLVFWVLGFIVDDIRTMPGPDYAVIKANYLDEDLAGKQDALRQQIDQLTQRIGNKKQKQQVLGDSSRSLQQTINQLIQLRKLGLQKGLGFSETEQANFSRSLALFLSNQRKYQQLSQNISRLLDRKQALLHEQEQVERAITQQLAPAQAAFQHRLQTHRLHLAFWQLAILLPILVLAAVVVTRKRGSIYFPLYIAVAAAALVKVTFVIHQYFPTEYLKYILIGVLLIVVARLLIHFIRIIAFPKSEWLVRQYREAYERFLCPVCEYPIRTGPRRYLFWTRRTVNKIVVPRERSERDEVYTCPACGETLFEECASCHDVRHTLLPNCMHCGVEKPIQ